MCALQAGRRGRSVLLVDHSEKIGRKILISGGGRCNFTNLHAKAENFHCRNPHFAKSALSRFSPADFVAMVEAHRISYHEKKLGQLFCDGTAENIVNMLISECRKAQVRFMTACRVRAVAKEADGFVLLSDKGELCGKTLVVATGGLSIPKIGASGFGYEIAKQFELKVEETFPALVGFDLSQQDRMKLNGLTGVSFDSIVSCRKHSFRENVLFTHTGISGPAVLQASLYWSPGDALKINSCPQLDLKEFLMRLRNERNNRELKNVLAEIYPKSLAEKLCELFLPSKPLNSFAEKTIDELCGKLENWSIVPERNFGYQKAEVTRGGVSTDELSAKTMEAKKVPGLFFVGEVVDVTGQLGGYNFQWAWASGNAAGQSV